MFDKLNLRIASKGGTALSDGMSLPRSMELSLLQAPPMFPNR